MEADLLAFFGAVCTFVVFMGGYLLGISHSFDDSTPRKPRRRIADVVREQERALTEAREIESVNRNAGGRS